MKLEDLGYDETLENFRRDHQLDSFDIGRVLSEHKERYIIKSSQKEYEGEIVGNLRFSAQYRSDFPAVGDWVAISEYDDNKVLIHAVYPRKSIIQRQAVGKHGEKQIIAANIDFAFIVQAVDRDFNINRIERYLTICYESKVEPYIILNKIDLIESSDLQKIVEGIQRRISTVPIACISNYTRQGISELKNLVLKGKTYCLLGSSGVGKSTLINMLSGRELMKTNTISDSTHKGKHVTTHREMIILENGGILIDNPGMREVGIADASGGIEITFEKIVEIASDCKFKDCSHVSESGCAVISAVKNGQLEEETYENFLKMEREKQHFESTVAERRKKDKEFGKMVKHFKKAKNHNRP